LGTDRTRSALEFVQTLIEAGGSEPLEVEGLLGGLAKAFGSLAAGLAGPVDAHTRAQYRARVDQQREPSWRAPWDDQPKLLSQIRNASPALDIVSPGGDKILVTAAHGPDGTGWLVWLEDGAGRDWTAAEAAALALAGQAVARLTTPPAGATGWAGRLRRLRFQQRLEEAAGVTNWLAHDFGNVLTGVLGFSELCLDQLPPDSEPHQFISEIRQTAQKGADFLRKLLLFSRRNRAQSGSASLASVAVVEAARLRAAWGPAVDLRVSVPVDLPPVAIDAEPLRQLLAALLDNALKALPAGGAVTVSAERVDLAEADCQELLGRPAPGPYAEVTVADTGRGLSPEARQALLTEPFFSTRPRHHGMGLPMVYGILYTHRGGLCLQACDAGGTRVRVVLPLIVAAGGRPA
jgi:signal transduction histidine kinase